MSNCTYKLIEPPMDTEICKGSGLHLGRSKNGVYLASLHTPCLLMVWVLEEAHGQTNWVLKHNICLRSVFVVPQIDYLGHSISGNGVSTDSSKIVVLADWPISTTVTQLRAFLGLCGYYRRFVKNFGSIARPLHDVLNKGSFGWAQAQD